MKKKLILSLILLTGALGVYAQYEGHATYVNSIYYFNRLNVMRTSYDRWSNLYATFMPGVNPSEHLQSAFSAVIDGSIYAKDNEGTRISPQTFGLGMGNKLFKNTAGFYFLLHTSDMINLTTWDRELWSAAPYNAFSFGTNLDFRIFTLQGDVTRVNKEHWFYYGKFYTKYLKTHFGVSLSNYDEIIDSVVVPGQYIERIVVTDKLKPDKFDFSTSIFKFFNFGFRYFKLLNARYVPNVNFALHQFYNYEKHVTMPIDIEVFFETRGKQLIEAFSIKDYEVRLCTYFFTKEGEVGELGNLVSRPAFFLGLSYKSPEDGFTKKLTESGKAYTGMHGFGGELGWGYRILGFQRFGFPDNTFFKYSLYYNYSQYFERYPGIQWGMKCRILM